MLPQLRYLQPERLHPRPPLTYFYSGMESSMTTQQVSVTTQVSPVFREVSQSWLQDRETCLQHILYFTQRNPSLHTDRVQRYKHCSTSGFIIKVRIYDAINQRMTVMSEGQPNIICNILYAASCCVNYNT